MCQYCEAIERDPEAYIQEKLEPEDLEGQEAYRQLIDLNILRKQSGTELDEWGHCRRMAGFALALAQWGCS